MDKQLSVAIDEANKVWCHIRDKRKERGLPPPTQEEIVDEGVNEFRRLVALNGGNYNAPLEFDHEYATTPLVPIVNDTGKIEWL